MAVYAHNTIQAAYRRVRENGIEHDQAVRAVAQAFAQEVDEIAGICADVRGEFDKQPQPA